MITTFKVTTALNGSVIETTVDGEEPETTVYQETDGDSKVGWAAFLRTLTDMHGPCYNKWGKEEITICIRPGHKCELADDVEWFLTDLMYKKPTKEQVEKVATLIQELFKEEF